MRVRCAYVFSSKRQCSNTATEGHYCRLHANLAPHPNVALEAAAHAIRQAITNAGPRPEYHRRTYLRHRAEWPTLWAAIDAMLDAMDTSNDSR